MFAVIARENNAIGWIITVGHGELFGVMGHLQTIDGIEVAFAASRVSIRGINK